MFGKFMHLSIFYCFCYEIDISTYMSEDQVLEERYPDLNEEEGIITGEMRDGHWRGVVEEVEDKNKIHALM